MKKRNGGLDGSLGWLSLVGLILVGAGCGWSGEDDDATVGGEQTVAPTGTPAVEVTETPAGDDDVATPRPDKEAPSLSYDGSSLTTAEMGVPIEILATITDSSGIAEAAIYYQAEGASKFAKVTMEAGRKGEYTGTIPGSAVKGGELSYYLEAIDASAQANVTRSPENAPTKTWQVDTGYVLEVAPVPSSLEVGEQVQLEPSGGKGAYHYLLEENNSGGLVSPQGLYTAGVTPEATDVVKITDDGGGLARVTLNVVACQHSSDTQLIRDNLVGRYVKTGRAGAVLATPFRVGQASFSPSQIGAYFGKLSSSDVGATFRLHVYRDSGNGTPGTELLVSNDVKVVASNVETLFTFPKKTVLPAFLGGDTFWVGIEYREDSLTGKILPLMDDGTLGSRGEGVFADGGAWLRMGLSPLVRVHGCAVLTSSEACEQPRLLLTTTDPEYIPVLLTATAAGDEVADRFVVNQSDFVLSQVRAYFNATSGVTTGSLVKAVIYSELDGQPASALAVSEEQEITELYPAYHTFTFADLPPRFYPGEAFWVGLIFVEPSDVGILADDGLDPRPKDDRIYTQGAAMTRTAGGSWGALTPGFPRSAGIQALGCSHELAEAGDLYNLSVQVRDDTCGGAQPFGVLWLLNRANGQLDRFTYYGLSLQARGSVMEAAYQFYSPYWSSSTPSGGLLTYHYEGYADLVGDTWEGYYTYYLDTSTDPAYPSCYIEYAVTGTLYQD